MQLPSYRLPFVAEALGLHLTDHHNALADATAAAQIVNRLAARHNASSLQELASVARVSIGHLRKDSYKGSLALRASSGGTQIYTPVTVNTDADPSGYLYGRVVVFTGKLESLTRDEARQATARAGGMPEDNTTRRTNILVVGAINPASLSPGATLTGKARKAFDLQAKGQAIEVMTEDDFLRCL